MNCCDRLNATLTLKKFKEVIELNSARIGIESTSTEIKEIAELRTKTSVRFKQSTLETIRGVLTENLEAQAYRTRLSEICLACKRVIAHVNKACKNMKTRIHLNYSEEIKTFGRSKEDRELISNTALRFAYDFVYDLESLIEMAQLIISDIDKQHFSLKLTKEALELCVHRESILT